MRLGLQKMRGELGAWRGGRWHEPLPAPARTPAPTCSARCPTTSTRASPRTCASARPAGARSPTCRVAADALPLRRPGRAAGGAARADHGGRAEAADARPAATASDAAAPRRPRSPRQPAAAAPARPAPLPWRRARCSHSALRSARSSRSASADASASRAEARAGRRWPRRQRALRSRTTATRACACATCRRRRRARLPGVAPAGWPSTRPDRRPLHRARRHGDGRRARRRRGASSRCWSPPSRAARSRRADPVIIVRRGSPAEAAAAPCTVDPWRRRSRDRHPDLLSPSGPRDGRRAARSAGVDLPGLHDADARRHALPECSRQRTQVRTLGSTRSEPRVTVALMIVCAVAFLASGSVRRPLRRRQPLDPRLRAVRPSDRRRR